MYPPSFQAFRARQRHVAAKSSIVESVQRRVPLVKRHGYRE